MIISLLIILELKKGFRENWNTRCEADTFPNVVSLSEIRQNIRQFKYNMAPNVAIGMLGDCGKNTNGVCSSVKATKI